MRRPLVPFIMTASTCTGFFLFAVVRASSDKSVDDGANRPPVAFSQIDGSEEVTWGDFPYQERYGFPLPWVQRREFWCRPVDSDPSLTPLSDLPSSTDSHELTVLGRRFTITAEPIPAFIVLNVLLIAIPVWIAFHVAPLYRARSRARQGLCHACSYQMPPTNICPECGPRLRVKER